MITVLGGVCHFFLSLAVLFNVIMNLGVYIFKIFQFISIIILSDTWEQHLFIKKNIFKLKCIVTLQVMVKCLSYKFI